VFPAQARSIPFTSARAANELGAGAGPVRRLMKIYFTGQANNPHHFAAPHFKRDIAQGPKVFGGRRTVSGPKSESRMGL